MVVVTGNPDQITLGLG